MKYLGLFLKGLRIVLIGLGVFAAVYMILLFTQMSATSSPLKTYHYALTDEELYLELENVVSMNKEWTLMITDSTGPIGDRRYHCKLIKSTSNDSLTISLYFEHVDPWFDSKTKSEISVTSAWDNIQWTGGYKHDDPQVETMLALFEKEILNGLESNTSR